MFYKLINKQLIKIKIKKDKTIKYKHIKDMSRKQIEEMVLMNKR